MKRVVAGRALPVLLGITLAALVLAGRGTMTLRAEQKGSVTVERIAFGGWQNCVRLSNGEVELVLPHDIGPRVMRYAYVGSKNVLKEYMEQMGRSGEADWQIRGGHRLWVAPEDLTRTYALDNGPVTLVRSERPAHGVRLVQPSDAYGIQKTLEVTLEPKGSRVRVVHILKNTAREPAELAPWALTVMAPGGTEIIPLPPKKPHPGPTKNAKSPADYAANQFMAIWPYFDFKDPRWSFGTRFITLRQDARRGPTKIGLAHRLGWVGYLNDGTLFVKQLPFQEGKHYPDGGCNFETFTNEDMLEIESLGPIVTLAPGQEVSHVEEWQLFRGVQGITDEQSIQQTIVPLVETR